MPNKVWFATTNWNNNERPPQGYFSDQNKQAEWDAYTSSKFNGFPFPTIEKNQNNEDFEQWDEETLFDGKPSGSEEYKVSVLGNHYSYKFTYDQLFKLFWRMKAVTLKLPPFTGSPSSYRREEYNKDGNTFVQENGEFEKVEESKLVTELSTNFWKLVIDGSEVGIDFTEPVLKLGENDYRPYIICDACEGCMIKTAAVALCEGSVNPLVRWNATIQEKKYLLKCPDGISCPPHPRGELQPWSLIKYVAGSSTPPPHLANIPFSEACRRYTSTDDPCKTCNRPNLGCPPESNYQHAESSLLPVKTVRAKSRARVVGKTTWSPTFFVQNPKNGRFDGPCRRGGGSMGPGKGSCSSSLCVTVKYDENAAPGQQHRFSWQQHGTTWSNKNLFKEILIHYPLSPSPDPIWNYSRTLIFHFNFFGWHNVYSWQCEVEEKRPGDDECTSYIVNRSKRYHIEGADDEYAIFCTEGYINPNFVEPEP